MAVIPYMKTPRGNEVEVTRIIGVRTHGQEHGEDLYFGYLWGEPITVRASEANLFLRERD